VLRGWYIGRGRYRERKGGRVGVWGGIGEVGRGASGGVGVAELVRAFLEDIGAGLVEESRDRERKEEGQRIEGGDSREGKGREERLDVKYELQGWNNLVGLLDLGKLEYDRSDVWRRRRDVEGGGVDWKRDEVERWARRDLGRAMMGYDEPAGAGKEAWEPLVGFRWG
jgi:hypothetical protein